MSEITLNQWVSNYANGMYDAGDRETQCNAGWYDWFCRDSSLKRRLDKMATAVRLIAKSPKIDADNTYVFFKNNCLINGPTYDDFRICGSESGDVIYTVIPKCTHSGKAEVWGKENGFSEALVVGTMRDVYKYFGV